MSRNDRMAARLLQVIGAWGVIITSAVSVIVFSTESDADKRAILGMGISLIVIWCVFGGIVMRLFRDRIVAAVKNIRINWKIRFVLFCIVLAMLEEAVTTSLTNAAPLFGAVSDAARITASRNYLEVVLFHSVIAFVPMFICWAWLLDRYAFSPVEVLLLFGLNGTLAETLSFGPQNLLQVGMWTFVYGLMVYLPAHTVPPNRDARTPGSRHWLLAAFLPLVFIVPLACWIAWKLILHIYRTIAHMRLNWRG